jgi:hypothetical protein
LTREPLDRGKREGDAEDEADHRVPAESRAELLEPRSRSRASEARANRAMRVSHDGFQCNSGTTHARTRTQFLHHAVRPWSPPECLSSARAGSAREMEPPFPHDHTTS